MSKRAAKGMPRHRVQPRIPVSTYRLQFSSQVTFRDAVRIIPYLSALGISDLYSSPYLVARRGSGHGYDIVSHAELNPEVGTEDEYWSMVRELSRQEMGQLLDIVPNHMCIESSENRWWRDVLENGPSSPYARFFDIDWTPVKRELENKILVPVLGDQYGNVLDRGEFSVSFEEGGFFVSYFEHRFPAEPKTYLHILEHGLDDLRSALGDESEALMELLSIITAIRNLPSYTDTAPDRIQERQREKEVIKKRLAALHSISVEVGGFIEKNVDVLCGRTEDDSWLRLLDGFLGDQVYRLSHWRVATEEINYRRFFDVNDLGAIRVEVPSVFEETHRLILRLVKEGAVTGFRVDHPDGLYDPTAYFQKLQKACYLHVVQGVLARGERERQAGAGSGDDVAIAERAYDELVVSDDGFRPFYIVAEKILSRNERMPEEWPIFSTTGYTFMNSVNGIFIDTSNAKAFDEIYGRFLHAKVNFHDILYEKKKLIMQASMSSEINTLGHYLDVISEKDRHTRDFTLNSLTGAITEVIAFFPVYRTYINSLHVSERDCQYIEHAISKARRKNPAISASIFEFLESVLMLRLPEQLREQEGTVWVDFVMRFQQITGPVMAKGLEDTACYVYNRLVSLNEVGGDPEKFGTQIEAFHGQNIERRKAWPHALITTSTHDAKRSEDVRARIDVISEIPGQWRERLRRWSRMNRKKKAIIYGSPVPDRNEEYLFYQTLIGVWPIDSPAGEARDVLVKRVKDYMLKAIREAREHTSWINQDALYEDAVLSFIEAALGDAPEGEFMKDFLPFQKSISAFGMYNSLSQSLLKITVPGVPDFYQGTEIWEFSLVDPDNRRPVDYDARMSMLRSLELRQREVGARALARELALRKEDGRIKLYLIWRALHARKDHRRLFEEGEYVPLEADGEGRTHLCAFARTSGGMTAITVVPRLLASLLRSAEEVPVGPELWKDTLLFLPPGSSADRFINVFTGEEVGARQKSGGKVLLISEVFSVFPAALLMGVSTGASRGDVLQQEAARPIMNLGEGGDE